MESLEAHMIAYLLLTIDAFFDYSTLGTGHFKLMRFAPIFTGPYFYNEWHR
jgi:hypothetical protein